MASEQIKDICDRLLKMFESGEFPPAAARTVISRMAGDERPSSKWSFCNQLIMLLSGTEDARGFRQWREAGRNVDKGAKAIYILVPLTRRTRIVVTDNDSGESREETIHIIRGFRTAPVFRYEDTEGEPLPADKYLPPQLPPLYNVAQHFGMVRYYPICGGALGSCSSSGTITLHSHDVDVFFHELAHLVHGTIRQLKPGQDTEQELVAEMVSVTLCELYGMQGYQWQGWSYMSHYVNEDAVATLRAIGSVLNEVEAVISKILAVDSQLSLTLADVG